MRHTSIHLNNEIYNNLKSIYFSHKIYIAVAYESNMTEIHKPHLH